MERKWVGLEIFFKTRASHKQNKYVQTRKYTRSYKECGRDKGIQATKHKASKHQSINAKSINATKDQRSLPTGVTGS